MAAGMEGTRIAKKRAIIKSLREGATVREACRAADVGITTFYRWVAKPYFRAKVEEAQQVRVSVAKNIAFECVKQAQDDPRYQTTLIAWLNNEADWRHKTSVEMERSVKELTNDELRAIIAAENNQSGSGSGVTSETGGGE